MPTDQLSELLATVKSQGEQIAALTTAQAATATKAVVADEGFVRVKQWRTTMFAGKSQKVDETEQVYTKAEFADVNSKHPGDKDRTKLEVLGLVYEIVEDTRV